MSVHLNRFAITRINEINVYVCFKHFVSLICWVRIDQRVGYELIESGYELSEPVYESSGYERSMGTKRLDTQNEDPIDFVSACIEQSI